MKKTLMYLVRHGSTTDSGKNIFRGQRDSALDKKGFLDAHTLKEFFERREWNRIFCSPMTRAIQTATIICDDQSDYQPETTDGLEPWNIGFITGLPKNEENTQLIDYFEKHKDEAPEGGESLAQFEGRVHPLLAEGISLGWEQDVPCIIVAHSSIVHSLNHLLVGEDHTELAVKPGGVVEIYLENNEIFHRPIFKTGHDDSSFKKS
jgi:broad specificity phosphatase PhoE